MEVFLTGSFNDWQPAQFQMKDRHGDGTYAANLLLRKGRTEYKFIVNGDWRVDPSSQESATSDNGAVNSVVTVA
jgi:1,4-alpha-glucan branching enzyme